MHNTITVMGRVCRDPKEQQYGDGHSLVRITVATDVREKVDGRWDKVGQFYSVTLFGRDADTVRRFVKKSSVVCVTGELHAKIWNSNNGPKIDLSIESARLSLGPRQDAQPSSGGYPYAKPLNQGNGQPQGGVSDDLPF